MMIINAVIPIDNALLFIINLAYSRLLKKEEGFE